MPSFRSAVFSNQFYPADKSTLRQQIKHFFSQVSIVIPPPKIILVPHAGYQFSGLTAATAYKNIDPNTKTVILLGASHTTHFSGAVTDDHTYWQMPFGQVPLNQDLIKKLHLHSDSSIHQGEHSLEVQIPFLQTILSDFSIVPILLGQTNDQFLNDFSVQIKSVLGHQTLLVISSDLSHYLPQSEAESFDSSTVDAILNSDLTYFDDHPDSACAFSAIKLALMLRPDQTKLLDLTNSAISSGDSSRVVGYASIAFYFSTNPLLSWSKKVLTQFIKKDIIPPDQATDPKYQDNRGVFVTLYKNKDLRGCIGTFEADQPLWDQVRTMTIAAATKDLRFPPVTVDELPDITIEISVLSPLKKVTSIDKINFGIDGVYLKQGHITGTFLPQVAQKTGWTKQEFLEQLCHQKMGLKPDCYLDPKTAIYTYTVDIIK